MSEGSEKETRVAAYTTENTAAIDIGLDLQGKQKKRVYSVLIV